MSLHDRLLTGQRPGEQLQLRLVRGTLAVAVAIGVGLLVGVILLPGSVREFLELALYIAIAAATTMGVGWVVLYQIERRLHVPLTVRAFLGTSVAGLVALANVAIVASLMFVDTQHDLRLLFVLVAAGGVVSTVFSVTVAGMTSRNAGVVDGAVRRLAARDYRPLDDAVGGGGELATLMADVERLRLQLIDADRGREALNREREELSTAISHDLRTPLGSIRAIVEALDDGLVEDPEEIRSYYRTLGREVERLSRLVDDLFDLSRIDAGAFALERRTVAVQDIAAEVVDAMQALALRREVALELDVDGEPAPRWLDGECIERAVSNLVRNGLEHTPVGGRVRVRVCDAAGGIRLSVHNTGEPIPASQLPHIWKRFYRGTPSRARDASQSTEGAGLGLSIVRGMVELHGGTVQAEPGGSEGMVFHIDLPVDPPPRERATELQDR